MFFLQVSFRVSELPLLGKGRLPIRPERDFRCLASGSLRMVWGVWGHALVHLGQAVNFAAWQNIARLMSNARPHGAAVGFVAYIVSHTFNPTNVLAPSDHF